MITLLAALAIPIIAATYLLARKRDYKPTYQPGGPLPKRRPVIDEATRVA